MRSLPLAIALFFISFGSYCQTESRSCEELTELIQEGKYKSAYRYLMVNGENSCGSYRYAEVLKWNGRYAEALEVLTGQSGEEVIELKQELEEHLGIRKRDELYSVRAFDQNDSLSRQLFAVAYGQPIFVDSEEVQTSFFPRKITEERVLFEQVGKPSEYFENLVQEFTERQEKHRLKLGSGWITGDSLLYYSAYYQAPLSSGGFHSDFAIYQWDGQSHELLKNMEKDGAYVHPTITQDGWLIFSSNRAGGFGGMDLWKLNLRADKGEPINLGSVVNSAYDEVYPAEAGDSLYFATNNPEKSIGGFDIMLYYEGVSTNPGTPLNSASEDIQPYTVNRELAYLITDRLYPDSLKLIVKVKPFKSRLLFDLLHGEINNSALIAGEKVELLDSDGNLLDYTYVDKKGRFTFTAIKGMEDYTMSFPKGKLEEGDKVRLFDKNFGLMEELQVDESGQAKFELLTPEDYTLQKEANTDDSMLSVDISGLLSVAEENVAKGVEIFLQDSEGNTIARAFTSDMGRFIFEQVRPDEAYSFQSAVVDMGAEIKIFNQDGEIIERIKPDHSGDLVYIRLKESDKIITITNEENVMVKVAEEEKFDLPAIYFEANQSELSHGSGVVLNNLVTILKDNPHVAVRLAGHTDSKGKAAYNLHLSQQRIESVERYLIQNGVRSERISGEGFGESRLVNHCDDITKCSEREHAENRRIEVQFYSNR